MIGSIVTVKIDRPSGSRHPPLFYKAFCLIYMLICMLTNVKTSIIIGLAIEYI